MRSEHSGYTQAQHQRWRTTAWCVVPRRQHKTTLSLDYAIHSLQAKVAYHNVVRGASSLCTAAVGDGRPRGEAAQVRMVPAKQRHYGRGLAPASRHVAVVNSRCGDRVSGSYSPPLSMRVAARRHHAKRGRQTRPVFSFLFSLRGTAATAVLIEPPHRSDRCGASCNLCCAQVGRTVAWPQRQRSVRA